MQITLFKWLILSQNENCTVKKIIIKKRFTPLVIVSFPWKHSGQRKWWKQLVQGHVVFKQHSHRYFLWKGFSCTHAGHKNPTSFLLSEVTVKCCMLFSSPGVVHIHFPKCQLTEELHFQLYMWIRDSFFFSMSLPILDLSFYIIFSLCLCFWSQCIWG